MPGYRKINVSLLDINDFRDQLELMLKRKLISAIKGGFSLRTKLDALLMTIVEDSS